MIHQVKPCNTYAELEDVNTPPDMSLSGVYELQNGYQLTAMYK